MNSTQLNGKWTQIKGLLTEKYGEITGDDIAKVRGDVEQLIGVVSQKAGVAREEIEQFLSQSLHQASTVFNRVGETAKSYADDVAHYARDSYDHISDRARNQYDNTCTAVKKNPMESMAIAFGVGAVAGIATALFMSRKR